MKHDGTLEMIKHADLLIRLGCTGTPTELCRKLQTSKTTWHNLKRSLIEEHDFPIAYCRCRRTYYYTEEGYYQPAKFVRL